MENDKDIVLFFEEAEGVSKQLFDLMEGLQNDPRYKDRVKVIGAPMEPEGESNDRS